MLYFYKTVRAEAKTLANGTTIIGVTLGEQGRGRKQAFLPLPQSYAENDEIADGLHADLTIGFSKTGRPRINKASSHEMWLIIQSGHSYSRKGNGRIYATTQSRPEVYARGNGAEGDAGRIGNWDDILVKAHLGDIYRVQHSGYKYGIYDKFIIPTADDVLTFDFDDTALDNFEAADIIDPPIYYDQEHAALVTNNDEWERL